MKNMILIADDNPSVRTFLVKVIRRADPNANIMDVDTGNAALEAYRKWMPNLVILDHGLPDVDGFHVLEQLKHWYAAPYVVMVTGDPNLEEAAFQHGADEVWLKPMDVGWLLQHLSILLPAA